MARTALTVTDVSRAGVDQPAQQNADNTNGNKLPFNDGNLILELASSSGTSNFTVAIPGRVDGQSVDAREYAVGATPVYVGPFPPEVYNQPADGTLNIDCDSANGRIRVIHLP